MASSSWARRRRSASFCAEALLASTASWWLRSFSALTRRSSSMRSKNARVFRSSRAQASLSAPVAKRKSRETPTDATTRPNISGTGDVARLECRPASFSSEISTKHIFASINSSSGSSCRLSSAAARFFFRRGEKRQRSRPSPAASLSSTASQRCRSTHARPRRHSSAYLCWMRRSSSASWPRYLPTRRDASPDRTFSGLQAR
mmetsp:Transcript_30566/g.93438  ORF Transcript_30566/g.93438 Transcript_30566/m.93438 type:complete len:203 (+) Transcript_30566:335-943(+)